MHQAETNTATPPQLASSQYMNPSAPSENHSKPIPKHENTTTSHHMTIGKVTVMPPETSAADEEVKRSEGPVGESGQTEGATSTVPEPKSKATEDPGVDWIDRTNEPLGEIGNGYTLTSNLTSLYLTNNRIKEIKNLEPCLSLRELVLRQNLITVVDGLDCLKELVELDLYMNHIEEIPPTTFKANPELKKLDLSFNQLRTLEAFPSANLPNLEELYLIGNKIKKINRMPDMPKLLMLELGDNRIRDLENLENLTSLEGLWLGRNKLTQIQNLETLVNLRRLSLQSNRLEEIEGISHLQHLEELYLSHNGIRSMHGVEALTNLRVLDLGVNFIDHIEGVEKLEKLKEFWINGNELQSFEELELLSNARELETVYLEGNPLARDPDYQRKVLQKLPDSLDQLDALLVEEIRKGLSGPEGATGQDVPQDVPQDAPQNVPQDEPQSEPQSEPQNELQGEPQVEPQDEPQDKPVPREGTEAHENTDKTLQ